MSQVFTYPEDGPAFIQQMGGSALSEIMRLYLDSFSLEIYCNLIFQLVCCLCEKRSLAILSDVLFNKLSCFDSQVNFSFRGCFHRLQSNGTILRIEDLLNCDRSKVLHSSSHVIQHVNLYVDIMFLCCQCKYMLKFFFGVSPVGIHLFCLLSLFWENKVPLFAFVQSEFQSSCT